MRTKASTVLQRPGARGLLRWTLLPVLLLGFGSATAIAAPPSQAAREFDRGISLAAHGDYLEAAAAFERAYKLAPHAAPLYNAGLAWEAAGDRPRAADSYSSALEMGGLGDAQTRDARRRLEGLRKTLGRIEVKAPAGTRVSIAHKERVEVPIQVHVERGAQTLFVWYSDGATESRKVTVGAEPIEMTLDPKAKTVPEPNATATATASAVPIVTPPEEGNGLRTLGWIALGTGVAVGGLTAYLGVQALGARSDYYDSGRTDRDAYDRAGSLRTWTNVALATSVVLGAGGLVLVLKSKGSAPASSHSREAAKLWVEPGPGSLVLGGRF